MKMKMAENGNKYTLPDDSPLNELLSFLINSVKNALIKIILIFI